MHTPNETTKVLVIPKCINRLEVVNIKYGELSKSLAVTEEHIYELRELGPVSEFDNKGWPQLPGGEALRSIILEPIPNKSMGAVLSDPNFIALAKFDMVFPFITWVTSDPNFNLSRAHTSEDITEGFLSSIEYTQPLQLLELYVLDCIDRTCESVEEHGEQFFKASQTKMHHLIAEKIFRMRDVLLENPSYILINKVKGNFLDTHVEVPKIVFEQQVLKFCTDFVFGTYLDETIREEHDKHMGQDYSELQSFLKSQEERQQSATIAELNLSTIHVKAKPESADRQKNNMNPVKATKKRSSKIAVGKGALDHFFKKK